MILRRITEPSVTGEIGNREQVLLPAWRGPQSNSPLETPRSDRLLPTYEHPLLPAEIATQCISSPVTKYIHARIRWALVRRTERRAARLFRVGLCVLAETAWLHHQGLATLSERSVVTVHYVTKTNEVSSIRASQLQRSFLASFDGQQPRNGKRFGEFAIECCTDSRQARSAHMRF